MGPEWRNAQKQLVVMTYTVMSYFFCGVECYFLTEAEWSKSRPFWHKKASDQE